MLIRWLDILVTSLGRVLSLAVLIFGGHDARVWRSCSLRKRAIDLCDSYQTTNQAFGWSLDLTAGGTPKAQGLACFYAEGQRCGPSICLSLV